MKTATAWTVMDNRVPIIVQHEETLALLTLDNHTPRRVNRILIRSDRELYLIERDDDGAISGSVSPLAKPGGVNSGVQYSPSTIERTRQLRRHDQISMLATLRQLLSTRHETLSIWYKKIWEEGIDLIRTSVPPIKLGKLILGTGAVVGLTFIPDSTGLTAAQHLLDMAERGVIDSPLIFRRRLEKVLNGGGWNTGDIGINFVSFSPNPTFDLECDFDFDQLVLPGVQKIEEIK